MERVRLNDCLAVEVLVRGFKKLHKDLVEAVDRTPYTVSSRHLIESALSLVEGLYNVVLSLEAECGSTR